MIKKRISILLAAAMLANCFTLCRVFAEEARENIAVFDYSAGTASDGISGGSAQEGYCATGGINKDEARLFASVNGNSYTDMGWSGDGNNFYTYNGGSSVSVPVMAASDSTPWGEKPYFLVKTSTKNFDNIKFSARISGTKKGPKDYTLCFSSDGISYTEIQTASVAASKNLDVSQIFAETDIEAAANLETAYFKIIAASTDMIVNAGSFVGATGGEAAINDIRITGTAMTGTVLTLEAPAASAQSGELYSQDAVELTAAEGADIYYSIDGISYSLYTEPVYPFKNTDKESVSISTYAVKEGYDNSPTVQYNYTCTSDKIAGFEFGGASDVEYVNGRVRAVSGIYGDAEMTASIDGINKYVPMYDTEMNAMVIAPDDAVGWSEGTHWQFELSTLGYNKVYLSANACSSNKGPASMTLQYSTDGVNFKNVPGLENKRFLSNTLEAYYQKLELPEDAAGCEKLYVRISSLEDMSLNQTPVWGIEKGNTYINNVVFAGDRNSSLKTPITLKKTGYFGQNGTIEYISPDGTDMKYNIYDKNGSLIVSKQDYPREGIALAKLGQFDSVCNNTFRIEIWSERDQEKSEPNSRIFKYKGDFIAQLDIEETTQIATGTTELRATGGAAADKTGVYMCPDGQTPIALINKNANLRASAEAENTWRFDKTREQPSLDGGWVIKTSTKGFKDIVITAKQSSTDKGPRDFCLAYSTDGVSFTDILNSSVKLTADMESTFSNFPLPPELENLDTVYIKIKIDGGETVGGLEMTSDEDEYNTDPLSYVYGKGNTEINGIELCAVPIENKIAFGTDEETLQKGGTYNIYYSSENESSALAAVYDEKGVLLYCGFNINTITVPQNAASVKLMLWDAPGKMHSLADSKVKKVG